ncbi:MAG: anaerobic glycerol-3-phosphate dehydrogenase subunit C [Actinomycetota bacterium]|nr:anaerobic glycerol-3-phosphate dehydrogenase subunit C [Actinomycetota bacterium]
MKAAGAPVPVEATLDRCIKCNICVTACPVSPVTDLFPGPKYEGPQAGRFRRPDQPSPDHSVDYCSGCRVCNMVCPTGVRIAEINARARARMVESGTFSPRQRLLNNLLARPELLGRLGHPLARPINALFSNSWARWGAHLTLGIHRQAPMPRYAGERFTTWFRRRAKPPPTKGRVVYFHGCSTEYYETRVGRAAVRVLEANGFEVLVPRQNCCGLPLLSNGEFPAARRYYHGNLRKLGGYARQGYPIVGTSTSCTLCLKEEALELLDERGEEASLLAASTFDLNEFLLEALERGELRTDLRPLPLRLAYHQPCQYRAHRLGSPALELMSLVPELEVMESPARCCGIAGTYGYKREKYQVAMDVGRPVFDFVRRVGGPVAVCDSETCRWQITHGTGVEAVHPVELLAASYGLEVEGPLAEALSPTQPGIPPPAGWSQ